MNAIARDTIGGAAAFITTLVAIWLLSGGPFIWLAAHVILNSAHGVFR